MRNKIIDKDICTKKIHLTQLRDVGIQDDGDGFLGNVKGLIQERLAIIIIIFIVKICKDDLGSPANPVDLCLCLSRLMWKASLVGNIAEESHPSVGQ